MHQTLETLKVRVSGPFMNLKEAEQSVDFLCIGCKEHIGHVSCFRETHHDKLPGHSRTISLVRLFVPSSASALCHSQDAFPASICLHLLSLSARNSKPCLLSHRIPGCCHPTHSHLHLPGHQPVCEQRQ